MAISWLSAQTRVEVGPPGMGAPIGALFYVKDEELNKFSELEADPCISEVNKFTAF